MNFFNIDLHISVIADIKKIIGGLGHNVDDRSLSSHSWVFNRKPDKTRVIEASSWMSIDKSTCKKFYDEYKDELSGYDAFIVTYPPVFSALFEGFNKPIIIDAPIRLESSMEKDEVRLKWFIDYLRNGIDNKQIIPVANNKYDKRNCERLTEREWTHIPNICDYTELKYQKNNGVFLLYSKLPVIDSSLWVWKDRVYPYPFRYYWKDLYRFRGMVHVPYNVSTMSIFEQYTAGFPLVFPSLDFAYENWEKLRLFAEIGTTKEKCPKEDLALCDFYDSEYMPYITYFDSNKTLEPTIKDMNVEEIADKMEAFNVIRKAKIIDKWKVILEKINGK